MMEHKELINMIDTANLNVDILKDKGMIYNNYNVTGKSNLMKCKQNKDGKLYTITEFVGIKSKMYSYQKIEVLSSYTLSASRAKGLNKSVKQQIIQDTLQYTS